MDEQKPWGWRPYTEEQRRELREMWTEEQINDLEKDSVYRPDETAVLAYELAGATLRALVARLGREFLDEVQSSFEKRAVALDREEGVEGPVEARIMRESFSPDVWMRLRAAD